MKPIINLTITERQFEFCKNADIAANHFMQYVTETWRDELELRDLNAEIRIEYQSNTFGPMRFSIDTDHFLRELKIKKAITSVGYLMLRFADEEQFSHLFKE